MRGRIKLILVVVLVVLCGAIVVRMLRPSPRRAGDFDGDGRYQRAEWGGADAEGPPTTLSLYIGATSSVCDSYLVLIKTKDEGLIGSFGGTSPSLLDNFGDLFSGERPVLTWDLSRHPPGAEFQITTRYLDSKSRVIDEETITTSRVAEGD